MQAAEVTPGRTFAARFDHDEDFYTALNDFCRTHDIRQAFIPMFIAGLRNVELVGSCERIEDPEAPVWSSVHLEYVEALGGGTLAYDEETSELRPHIHVSVGLKTHSASGYTSHLLGATVQFLTEMYVVEVADPTWSRPRNPSLYDVPLLTFNS
ncbi:putative DNA-binding protein with PD1-like motif [Kribbella steppae]|uniref:Putative DNA-binding protein with PD1-like motif n=1 Tax=Kribbella steppae TaxID=2512223 RepID=A0A4R2HFT4_9ACTN|nr:PPC domain-containing DNA-binding protein [Kribbella steppae]TCO28091.1 putative DNA-binding protein with PD1-like motif [Kribbella steppae]